MTRIFTDEYTFYNREDKTENGVSKEFAEENPNWEEENKDNKGCWNCSRCSDCSRCSRCSGCSRCSDCSRCSRCSGCSDCSDCSGCSDCSRCSGCSGCSGCSDCSDCSDCSRCSGCSRCSRCSGCSRCSDCSRCSRCSGCSDCSDCSHIAYLRLKENINPGSTAENPVRGFPDIPIIENIHQKVYEAVSKPGALNMDTWHTCDTTHCRAGWVVHLAGMPGAILEKETSTQFAAMQIYKASSPEIRVSPPRFFEKDEVALADIKACAEKESQVTQ